MTIRIITFESISLHQAEKEFLQHRLTIEKQSRSTLCTCVGWRRSGNRALETWGHVNGHPELPSFLPSLASVTTAPNGFDCLIGETGEASLPLFSFQLRRWAVGGGRGGGGGLASAMESVNARPTQFDFAVDRGCIAEETRVGARLVGGSIAKQAGVPVASSGNFFFF